MTYIYDALGIKRDLSHVRAVDNLVKIKSKSGSNPWPVIEECIKVWESTHPTQWKSLLIEIKDVKETRRDSKYASSKPDPVHGGILRYTLDIPEKVQYMIRCLYTPEERPMDRKFFIEFARRFPRFKIAEKL